MDATSFFLVVFHLACSSAMGVVAGLQFVRYFEYEVKKIKKYYYCLGYFITIFSVIFLLWVMVVTGGFNKRYWVLIFLYFSFILISIYLTIKILFKKKGLSFSDQIPEQ
jgi:L-asparagine transporter-like permease